MYDIDVYDFLTEKDEEGTRLDVFLSSNMEDFSRSYIQKIIEMGNVCINGKIELSKKYKVKREDKIEIKIPKPVELEIIPEDIPLDIYYEDEDVVVVNKPKGMVVHPAAGNYTGTMVNALLYHCKNLSSINGVIRPGIVHRIDKDTSGLLVAAKNDRAHASLAEQFKEHSIKRVYHAITYGNIKDDSGTVDLPIGRHPTNRLKMAVTDINSRNAVTHYVVRQRFENFTYIEARLETGRTHQIRVHMAYIHHPLLGDMLYGPKKTKYNIEGQILHAKILGFIHPRTGDLMEFECDLPKHFNDAVRKIKGKAGEDI
ncbi:MAG: RluA family pseudouridine synthase [Clostridiales bacterium]|nr:RluA family pseudouridine synthase [Clostridiales bacterium]